MVNKKTVFLKGPKKLTRLGQYAGGVMNLYEVLDCLVLKNEIISPLEAYSNSTFIPINLFLSEEKILKGLNIIGLFLQTKKHIHWLIPLLLSLTSAVLEFCTPLRRRIYSTVNAIFCWAMHPPCDCLPLMWRFVTYYFIFGWMENLTPSNDVEWRVVRGVNTVVIGGGAKVSCLEINAYKLLIQSPTQLEEIPSFVEFCSEGEHTLRATLKYDANGRKATITVDFKEIKGTYYRISGVDCDEEKYVHLRTFIECLVRNRSGSLESYEAKGRVCTVRGFRESILCYVKSGYPEMYELRLENAVVK